MRWLLQSEVPYTPRAILGALQEHALFMAGTMNINDTLLWLCLFY